MANTSILSPLLRQFRADTKTDFRVSPARSLASLYCEPAEEEDHELEDNMHLAFRNAGYMQLRHIGATHHNGRVELQGRVPTYFLKQVAQSVVASLPGVRLVVNNIEVASPR